MTGTEFAQWREWGIRAAVVSFRGARGWFVVCASCELERACLGLTLATWEVDSHNSTAAHAVAAEL